MRVDRVVLRAALSTLAAIFTLLVLMFAALAFIYPSTMMKITYDLGLDGASVRYAARAYDRGGEIYYIAFATEVAIGDENYEKIDACGSKFIKDDQFTAYYAEKNQNLPEGATGTYEQYIYGQVCVAKYRLGKTEEAIEYSFELNGSSFAENNAVAAVALTAILAEDGEAVASVLSKLEAFKTEHEGTLGEEELAYLNKIIGFAQVNG